MTPRTGALAAGAVRQEAPEAFADVAARLKSTQEGALGEVNDVILSHLESGVPLIPEVARHLIGAGGKRLRPLMTLASAEICGLDGGGDRFLAAAVELIHAATLLHDDVVDDSALRRGLKTANVVFGNKESVLVGDFLFARAFELMVKTGSLRVLSILSSASCTISEGEVLQLATQANLETTLATYEEVVRAKTAALFSAATQSGAALAEASQEAECGLADFGMNFGIAYQMVDDALDYEGSDSTTGKRAGDDFREGKLTLPVIYAIAEARDEAERAFWSRTIGRGDRRDGDFAQAQAFISRDGLVERALDRARSYADKAVSALSVLPASDTRETLASLARSSAVRLA